MSRQAENPPGDSRSFRSLARGRLAVPALLLALTVTAYVPALWSGFIWDDNSYVTENSLLRTGDGLRQIWFKPGSFVQYYPLTLTSFWLEYRLWGLSPKGFHATNVVLHAFNVVLLWLLLSRLGVPAAALVAALFAVHPVHVESVAWVTERKNVLSGFFYLAAANAYLGFSPPGGDARLPRRWGLYAMSFLFFAAALFSKTVTSTLPAALLLLEWWKRGKVRLREVAPTVPFLALGALLGSQTARMERLIVGAQGPEWDFSWVERGLIAGRAVWFYAMKLVWPHPLIFSYPRWTIDSSRWWQYLFPLGALAAAILLWRARHALGRGPLTAFLFFAGTLFPALGFFNVYPMKFSFVADHFQYLASIGALALLAALGGRIAAGLREPAKGPALALPAAAVLALCVLTWRQIGIYADVETLWRATIAANPGSALARNNLGQALELQGRLPEARSQIEEALRLKPDYADAHYNLAVAQYRQGEPAAAVSHLRTAVRLKPGYADAYLLLGRLLGETGSAGEAAVHLRRYLELRPRSPQRSFVQSLVEFYERQAAGSPRGGAP